MAATRAAAPREGKSNKVTGMEEYQPSKMGKGNLQCPLWIADYLIPTETKCTNMGLTAGHCKQKILPSCNSFVLDKATLNNHHNLFLQECFGFPYEVFLRVPCFFKGACCSVPCLVVSALETLCHGFNLHSPMNIWLAIAFIISSFVI